MASELTRRQVLAGSAVLPVAMAAGTGVARAEDVEINIMPLPPMNHRYLLSCKLTMIAKEANGKKLSLAERLQMAREAGFDGVDFDEAGDFSVSQAREGVIASRTFVHNAINHAHWSKRFTSGNEADQAEALANLEHCIRVSHAAGGSGVLLVPGRAGDGPADVVVERAIEGISKAIPLAAALGQPILFENVWNQMFYDHNQGPEQSADRWAEFVDAFNSPWVGMYHDIGNHWKYGNPGDWIETFGKRAVKFDLKGFSRATNSWTEIGEGDLPWDDVRQALKKINFAGWFTAEVGGGGLERLKTVRNQMAKVLGIS